MYGVRLVPAVASVGATESAVLAAVVRFDVQVPAEQTWPELQSASFLQEAASAGALASSAVHSVTAVTSFPIIQPSLSARGRARLATHGPAAVNLHFFCQAGM